ncbi:MAG: hypothetical protein C0411_02730 [Pseudomonas sp.]|nr:hypothetical protein [Pseudomonas sp.]
MLPPGCVAAPKNVATMPTLVSATHSSGSKLPRRKSRYARKNYRADGCRAAIMSTSIGAFFGSW